MRKALCNAAFLTNILGIKLAFWRREQKYCFIHSSRLQSHTAWMGISIFP